MRNCTSPEGHCWHIHHVAKKQPTHRTPLICCRCSQERKTPDSQVTKLLDSPKAALPMNKRDARWIAKARKEWTTAGISESKPWNMPRRQLPTKLTNL